MCFRQETRVQCVVRARISLFLKSLPLSRLMMPKVPICCFFSNGVRQGQKAAQLVGQTSGYEAQQIFFYDDDDELTHFITYTTLVSPYQCSSLDMSDNVLPSLSNCITPNDSDDWIKPFSSIPTGKITRTIKRNTHTHSLTAARYTSDTPGKF